MNVQDRVTQLLRISSGQAPAGLWSAPGRVNLIGEHTDYNGGFVLPFAINRRTWVAAAVRSDGEIWACSEQGDKPIRSKLVELNPETMSGWAAYVFGVAWALSQHSDKSLPGISLSIASEVPVGAGLSSSAAVECAVALALNDLWQLELSREVLAESCQLAENIAAGAPTGIMDQSASLLGARDHAVFLDCSTFHAEQVALGFDEAGLEVLVIDTGVSHSHATGGYANRRASCERAATTLGHLSLRDVTTEQMINASGTLDDETYRRMRHVVTENQRVLDTVKLLRDGQSAAIGSLLVSSHQSMRDDFEISCSELDLAVDASIATGALGARMTGGGFGGAAIALVKTEDCSRIRKAVESEFTRAGFNKPTCFVVRADDGAREEPIYRRAEN